MFDAELAAVIADPRDDVPRLVYADAVSTVDPARAEYIRLAVALAQPGSTASERRGYREVLRGLSRSNLARWESALKVSASVSWSRGFIDGVSASYRPRAGWLDVARLAPVTKVAIGYQRDAAAWEALLAASLVPRLEQLRISGAGRLLDLASVPVEALRFLGVSSMAATVPEALAQLPWVSALDTLMINSSRAFNDSGLNTLLAAHPAARWKNLYLSGASITDAGLEQLIRHPVYEGLEIVCLNRTMITSAGVAALAQSPQSRGLKMLEVANTKLDPAGVTALIQSDTLGGLTRLKVRGRVSRNEALIAALRARYPKVVIA